MRKLVAAIALLVTLSLFAPSASAATPAPNISGKWKIHLSLIKTNATDIKQNVYGTFTFTKNNPGTADGCAKKYAVLLHTGSHTYCMERHFNSYIGSLTWNYFSCQVHDTGMPTLVTIHINGPQPGTEPRINGTYKAHADASGGCTAGFVDYQLNGKPAVT